MDAPLQSTASKLNKRQITKTIKANRIGNKTVHPNDINLSKRTRGNVALTQINKKTNREAFIPRTVPESKPSAGLRVDQLGRIEENKLERKLKSKFAPPRNSTDVRQDIIQTDVYSSGWHQSPVYPPAELVRAPFNAYGSPSYLFFFVLESLKD